MSESGESLFDSELWAPALEAYGLVTHLTVQLYDASAKLRHDATPATPLFQLVAGTGEATGFPSCARECLTTTEPGAVVIRRLPGLGVVGTPLRLAGDLVGAAVAGYVLTDFPATLGLQRLARAHGLAFEAVWNLARGTAPVPTQRLTAYGQLLRVLGEALLREQLRSRETARLYQAAQVANRIKEEFLSTVSHELRAPLSAIVGWTQVLRSKRDNQAMVDRALDTIERNAKAQTRLIDDLLDVSRIVAEKVNLELRPIDLIPLIERTIDAVRPAAQAKGIALASELEDPVGRIVADPDRLQQVLLNLLSNALKFSSAGDSVTVRLRRVDRHVEIAVSDTGQGIGPALLPSIFDRFRQADVTTTRRQGGLGLGLAIVRHLVERHGGRVDATSPGEGRGATFTVTLPLPDVAEVGDAEARELRRADRNREGGVPPKVQALGGLRIVVVDDEADGREWLRVMLEGFGAQVTAVGSAAAALDALDAAPPAILLIDVAMPDVDGYTLLREVRMRTPERGARTPAVALTAYAGPDERERALVAGFDDHVAKPVQAAELVALIATLAGRAA